MENKKSVKSIIEALLVVSENGLSREDLEKAIMDADTKDIEDGISFLREEYSNSDRAFNIAEIAGRYRIVTKPEYIKWINKLYEKDIDRITGPSLETLAIIAYKQPVTRAEMESIRGVNIGGTVKTLLEKGLIEIRGRKNVLGRPLMYGTTKKFLEIFGLNSLSDLPILRDFSEDDLEYDKPQEVVEIDKEESLNAGEKETQNETEEEDNRPEDNQENQNDTMNNETDEGNKEEEKNVSEPEKVEEQKEPSNNEYQKAE